MSLPKIDLPIQEIKLPSTGKKIKFRPFTVKEEKILLVAQEIEEPDAELLAARQVINNCLINTDISKLAVFDLEYLLLILRSKSVDNLMKFSIADPDTGETVNLEVDIDTVELSRTKGHNRRVKVNDEWTLFLKYPTIDEFIEITKMDSNDPLVNYFIMVSCLESLNSEGGEVHKFKDYKREEIDQFMDDMTGDVLQGVQRFFDTMPKLRHVLSYEDKTGAEKTFVLEGMRSFFE